MNVYVNIIKSILAILIASAFGYYSYPFVVSDLASIKEVSIAVMLVFATGIIFTVVRFVSVYVKISWLDSYKSINRIATVSRSSAPKDFSSLAKKLYEKDEKINEDDCYVCAKSLETSINANKDAGKFLVKLCFIVSLLGAFLCILASLTYIANIFSNMNLDSNEAIGVLSNLQSQIGEPLRSLSKALSISFLGIFLSTLLSYIDRQVFIAENKTLVYLENWFLSCLNTKEK